MGELADSGEYLSSRLQLDDCIENECYLIRNMFTGSAVEQIDFQVAFGRNPNVTGLEHSKVHSSFLLHSQLPAK